MTGTVRRPGDGPGAADPLDLPVTGFAFHTFMAVLDIAAAALRRHGDGVQNLVDLAAGEDPDRRDVAEMREAMEAVMAESHMLAGAVPSLLRWQQDARGQITGSALDLAALRTLSARYAAWLAARERMRQLFVRDPLRTAVPPI